MPEAIKTGAGYQRQHRATNPDVVARNKALALVRRRALAALAELHPAEYVVLEAAECERLGIAPPGSVPTGRPPGGRRG